MTGPRATGFDRARQRLNDLENRLRRYLGLAGDIGASFLPTMTPVLIAGDLREPGIGDFRGRYFNWQHESVATAAGFGHCVTFAADVIILSVELHSATGGECILFPPGLGSPLTITRRPSGVWVDNNFATDAPPVADSGAGADQALAAGSPLNTVAIWHTNAPTTATQLTQPLTPRPMHLPAGSTLAFRAAGTSGFWRTGVYGRIF